MSVCLSVCVLTNSLPPPQPASQPQLPSSGSCTMALSGVMCLDSASDSIAIKYNREAQKQKKEESGGETDNTDRQRVSE